MPSDRPALIEYADALEIVSGGAEPFAPEDVPLDDLLGRVLARPVLTTHDMPFFDTSAMDGYAVTAADAEQANQMGSVRLPVAGTAAAGWDPTGARLQPGQALHILTGAALPAGVGAVVMQEDTVTDNGFVTVKATIRAGQHVRPQGEEFRAGDQVAPAGVVATPGVVAAIAAAGHASAPVHGRPAVGLLVTGDELVPPGRPLEPGRVYDANSFGIAASLEALRLPRPHVLRVADDLQATTDALHGLLDRCDVVLTSGGVSVGEFDTVKAALGGLGVEAAIWGVAIKPGKPFYYGRVPDSRRARAVFGLPGNPVAAMVTFQALVRPYLQRAMGLCATPRLQTARLGAALKKKAGRTEFVPCRLADGTADPVVRRGSHMLGTLVGANGLVLFPRALEVLQADAEVEVMVLEGGLA